jgi:hypothetical protein
LVVTGKYISDDGLNALKEMPLESLTLEFFPMLPQNEGWEPLQFLTRLDSLTLSNVSIGGKSLVYIASCTALKTLCLEYCYNISDADFIHFSNLPLINLYVRGKGCEYGDEALTHIAGLAPTLRALKLKHWEGLTDNGLVHVGKLSKLTNLRIHHCGSHEEGQKISPAGLEHLKPLKLRLLGLKGIEADLNLSAFKDMPIERLEVYGANKGIINDLIVALPLTKASLGNTWIYGQQSVDDETLALLATKPLKSLTVHSESMTDAGVSQLKNCRLTSCDLRGTHVTTEGVKSLLRAPLQMLDVRKTKVTYQLLHELAALQIVLPTLKVDKSLLAEFAKARLKREKPGLGIEYPVRSPD